MNLLAVHNSPETILAKTKAVYDTILKESEHLQQPNFSAIHTDDVARMFAQYDLNCFESWLGQTVIQQTGNPITFRLSSTMTKAGGKTIRSRLRLPDGGHMTCFEIAIGSRLLFMTFKDINRSVTVCGLECHDRLQALQRIMEHEIIHLAELLAWGESSCSAARFQTLAQNIFGHTSHRHDLVTPREHAATNHDISVGRIVEFEFDGVRHVGTVNRIHQRATVLVESEAGLKYSDGRKYLKFYIPLGALRVKR